MPKTTESIQTAMELLSASEVILEQAKADADGQIQKIKAALREQVAAPQKEAERLRKVIRRRALEQAERDGTRFHQTPFGTVQVKRNPPSLVVEDEGATLRQLHLLGREELVRRYEEPDLEALAGEPDELLGKIGIKRHQNETVHITVERVRVQGVRP